MIELTENDDETVRLTMEFEGGEIKSSYIRFWNDDRSLNFSISYDIIYETKQVTPTTVNIFGDNNPSFTAVRLIAVKGHVWQQELENQIFS